MPDDLFGFSPEQVDLVRHMYPEAGEQDISAFLNQASRRKLDPFSGQIKMSMRRSQNRDTKQWESRGIIITGIDGFRLIAQRSGEYEGQVGPFWCGKDGKWVDAWLSNGYPAAARTGVLRSGFREPLWAVALWSSYAPLTSEGKPQAQWAKMPDLMLAKVSEALALRRGFPEELGGLYTEDEMAQAGERTHREATGPAATPPDDTPVEKVSPLSDEATFSNVLTLMTGGDPKLGVKDAPEIPAAYAGRFLIRLKDDPDSYPDKAAINKAVRAEMTAIRDTLVYGLGDLLKELEISREEAKHLLKVAHMTDILANAESVPTLDALKQRLLDLIAEAS